MTSLPLLVVWKEYKLMHTFVDDGINEVTEHERLGEYECKVLERLIRFTFIREELHSELASIIMDLELEGSVEVQPGLEKTGIRDSRSQSVNMWVVQLLTSGDVARPSRSVQSNSKLPKEFVDVDTDI